MEINQKIDKTVDWLREKVKEAGCKGTPADIYEIF